MDVDRYITDEAVDTAYGSRTHMIWLPADMRTALRAALPGILAAHRADVLREAADYVERTWPPRPASGPAEFAYALRQLADTEREAG